MFGPQTFFKKDDRVLFIPRAIIFIVYFPRYSVINTAVLPHGPGVVYVPSVAEMREHIP